MEQNLSEAIEAYIQGRKLAKLESFQKKLDRAKAKGSESEQQAAQRAFDDEDRKLSEVYDPVIWLSDAAKRAKQISLSTHSAKFIHSDAKSSSFLALDYEESTPYLASCSLKDKAIDASGNAAALDVARLLKIQVDGRSLVDDIREGHVQALHVFTEDEGLRANWFEGFSLALSDSRLTSHNLAKQVYFPLQDGTYHLLMPLYASSLAQQFYDRIREARFSEVSKERREARKKEKWCEGVDLRFPNVVIQSFGGSKPQNISQLNSERYGNNYLLPCSPPEWVSQVKPLFNKTSFFNYELSRSAWRLLSDFLQFLEKLRPDQRNIDIRERRDKVFLQPIIDTVFHRAALFQGVSQAVNKRGEALHQDWSSDTKCKLKGHQKLWLDPENSDEHFQSQRELGDWQKEVSEDFARWLNSYLGKSKTLKFSDADFTYWKKFFVQQLMRMEWSESAARKVERKQEESKPKEGKQVQNTEVQK